MMSQFTDWWYRQNDFVFDTIFLLLIALPVVALAATVLAFALDFGVFAAGFSLYAVMLSLYGLARANS